MCSPGIPLPVYVELRSVVTMFRSLSAHLTPISCLFPFCAPEPQVVVSPLLLVGLVVNLLWKRSGRAVCIEGPCRSAKRSPQRKPKCLSELLGKHGTHGHDRCRTIHGNAVDDSGGDARVS